MDQDHSEAFTLFLVAGRIGRAFAWRAALARIDSDPWHISAAHGLNWPSRRS